MIIDRVQVAGPEAYLLDAGQINLATSPTRTGSSVTIPEGVAFEISGIRLYLEAKNLTPLFPNSGFNTPPLLELQVVKEMFPDLYADPYTNRVHTLAGHDDFNRGTLVRMRLMEVDGLATLVSLERGDCSYTSPLYRMYRPMRFERAAWDLATSRLTSSDGFTYSLVVEYWTTGQNPDTDAPGSQDLTPATGATPADLRKRENLGLKDVIAYRLVFKAHVVHDTYLTEFSERSDPEEPYGRPLLRKVHILETVPSPYAVHSLMELEARCGDFTIIDFVQPQRRLSAEIMISARLMENEQITLRVANGIWERVEARIIGEFRVRPPRVDKQMGS